MILRSRKDRQNPYVQINRTIFDDASISLKAKGLLGYCLAKPDNWTFHVKQMGTVLKEKEGAIRRALKELEEAGYCYRYQTRKPNGDWSGWETIISDSKAEIEAAKAETKKMFTDSDFAHAQSARSQNDELIINDVKENEANNPPPVPPKGDGAGMAYADSGPYPASTDARFRKIDPDEFDFLNATPIGDKLTVPEKMQLMRHPVEKVKQAIGWALERKKLGDLVSAIHHALRNDLGPKKADSMPISKKDITAWVDELNHVMAEKNLQERYRIDKDNLIAYYADFEKTDRNSYVAVPKEIIIPIINLYDKQLRDDIEYALKLFARK